MEFAACGNRDNPRLPPLSLGLTSVRRIVNKIEAEYARAAAASSAETNLELVRYDPNAVVEGYDDYYDPSLDSSKGRVWSRFAVNLGVALGRCIPSVSFWNFGVVAITAGFVAPRMISYLLLYPFCRLVFGTLYPAYASYKAVRTKNLKEYVKWMMYWIVFALFTCTETFTDVFLSWFPFYYEVKIVLVLWLLSPATKGSSILYRKFVHPALCRREQEIDEYIAKAKDQGYHTVLNLGTKGVNYATTVIMQTAIKGGGGLVQQIRKSYSLSDLSECDPRGENALEADDVLTEPRTIRRTAAKSGYNTRRSASESNSRSMYFPEVDLDVSVRGARTKDEPDIGHIKSSEDISSGYSSADNSASLTRTGSLSAASRAKLRSRTTVTTIKRPQAAEDEVIIEELHDDDSLEFANMPPLLNLPQNLYISNSDPPFIYQLVGDQVRIIQVLGSNVPNIPKFNKGNDNPDRWDQNEAYEDASPTVNDDVHNHDKNTSKSIELNTEASETFNKDHDPKEPITENLERTEEKNNVPIKSDKKDNSLHVNVPLEVPSNTVNKDNDKAKNTDDNIKKSKNLLQKNIVETSQPQSETSQNATNKQIIQVEEKQKPVNEEVEAARIEQNTVEDPIESTSLDTSLNDNEDDDSDDEASFGTPEDSPKSKRKSPVGKYVKRKAPLPPVAAYKDDAGKQSNLESNDSKLNAGSHENLTDIVKKLPEKGFKETGTKSLQVVNPIAEKKRRHKSKSPGRIPKSSGSGLGKLLQLPGKLAFWNKNDDKNCKDNASTSSGDRSRRSSTIEKTKDSFQSCSVPNEFSDVLDKEIADDQLSFKDAEFVETEIISHNIIEMSDELQKLIEAKIESHPEYKFVSLHEVATTSKSTDV